MTSRDTSPPIECATRATRRCGCDELNPLQVTRQLLGGRGNRLIVGIAVRAGDQSALAQRTGQRLEALGRRVEAVDHQDQRLPQVGLLPSSRATGIRSWRLLPSDLRS